MTDVSARADESAASFGIGFREFVALVAALIAIGAIGIDVMLPALPQIGASLDIVRENDRQWIIASYVLAMGAGQIVYGPLTDRFGRKPILLLSVSMFAVTSVIAAFADTFETMMVARALQGFAAASSRVLAVSIVRDRYSGRQMARVMSLVMIVFLLVPVLAPSLGQLILLVAPWQAIFLALALYGAMVAGWAALRLPETLHLEYRRPIEVGTIASAARQVVTNRFSIGYTLAVTFLFGGLMAFINISQQIFFDVFRAPHLFPIAFAVIASFMGFAAYANSRIVERLGTRRVSHSALLGYILITGVHVVVSLGGFETIWTFILLQGLATFCFAMIGSNFGSMAMEPMGHIAGTAASIQGVVSTIGGALLGLMISQNYDATVTPLPAGMALLGIAALIVTLITERGKLFRPQLQPADQ